jgi:hypothetical protein
MQFIVACLGFKWQGFSHQAAIGVRVTGNID